MSSGLPAIPGAARNIVKSMSPIAMRRIETLGMTPRQQDVNWYWSHFTCTRYDSRKVDWDGSERIDRIDAEAICTAGVLPPGFYDAGENFPVKFRRPTTQYSLVRVIVNRFTGLLFSESAHPRLRCVGDPDMEDYIGALAEAARLWAKMALARTYGGAMGSYCLGFKFINGKPEIEIHDPRWVTPKFSNLDRLEVESVDIRWMWFESVMGESGEFEQVWYWTRRIIDINEDVQWNKVPVGDGTEPDWTRWPRSQEVRHGFGFCPIIWGQNIPVLDQEDGEPDCLGVFDPIDDIDRLLSQGNMSLIKNLDPTVVINSDLKLAELRKGSDNAVKLEAAGGAKYMEGSFEGVKEAREQVMKIRAFVLEVAQCVLDNPDDTADKTATEVRRDTASMYARCDMFREQYGRMGVIPLLEMMIKAIRILGTSKIGGAPDGGSLRRIVILPPREITDESGAKSFEPRELPDEADQQGVMTLQWPPYVKPSLQEAGMAADAVTKAKNAGALDDAHAARFLASYFDVDDVPAMLLKIKSENDEKQKQQQQQMQNSFNKRGGF